MTLRLRWYRASSIDKTNLGRILAGLIKDEYSEKRRWGFSDVRLRGSFIEGQYIERNESVVSIQDPFGNPVTFPRIDYETFVFAIGNKYPHIELRNVPRSFGVFFNQIASYLNFKVGIEPIKSNLSAWIKSLEGEVDSIQVQGAIAANISLSNSIQARIAISGSTEVRPSIKKLTGKYAYDLNKIQVSGIFRSQPFSCDLLSEGRATISRGTESEIARILRKALVNAAELRGQ